MHGYFLRKVPAGNFDVLRGLAVSLVLLSHADAYEMILPQNKLTLFFKPSFGYVGVMLFFILSGCLIWQSASRCLLNYKTPWIQYFYQRIARILPLYLVSILVVVIVASSFKGGHVPDISLSNILRHVTFTQDINPSVARTINPVLWSLTHEAIFLLPCAFVVDSL
jgi:peptidoglycan/LPS O-acetylase OafA/YrhL